MHNYLIHLAVEYIKDGKNFNQFIENEIAANASDDELRKIWNDAWFSVGITKKVNKKIMVTTNYNRATAYFRNMEMVEPQDKKWGEFADAMDEVISTCVPIVRCKDCKHGEPGACGDGVDCDGVWHNDDWFCADGERKEGR